MKNLLALPFIILISIIFISCCTGKKAGKEVPNNNTAVVDTIKKDIIGIWVSQKGGLWFEFKANETFDMGRGDTLKAENKNYSIDKENGILLLSMKKGVKRMQFKFEGEFLLLTPEKKGKTMRLSKTTSRPIK